MTGTTGTICTLTIIGDGATLGTDTAVGTIRGIMDTAMDTVGTTLGTLQAGTARTTDGTTLGTTVMVLAGMTHGGATVGIRLRSLATTNLTETYITVIGVHRLLTIIL